MKVSLRPLKVKDAYTSVHWRNDPDIWTHTTFKAKREITIEDELKWIKTVMNETDSSRFAILADGQYVGNIYITNIEDDIGEYHIFIGEKDAWGKGIARKASGLLINHAKTKLGLKSIILKVKPQNANAHGLYKSLGFKDVGMDESGFMKMLIDLKA